MLYHRRTRKVSEIGLCLPPRHTSPLYLSHNSILTGTPQKSSVIGPPALVCPRTELHSPAVKSAVL